MELISAKQAYANTLLSKRRARRIMFNDLAVYFNNRVNKVAAQGDSVCIIRWKDFDVDENLATDEEAVTELIENILSAGYEVELCYNSPAAYNPCGIVVAWGVDAIAAIDWAFCQVEGRLWRGE